MVPSFNPQNPVNNKPVSVQPGICNTPANIEKGLAGNHGSASSSISEYLIEMLPGWRVEDFLVDSSPSSFGFCKVRNPPLPFTLLVVASRYGNSFSLLDVLQGGNANHQSSEPVKAAVCLSDARNEEVWDFSSLSRHSANTGKPHSKSTQAAQKAPIEINSSTSRCSYTLPTGCPPRVFCLGASKCSKLESRCEFSDSVRVICSVLISRF